MLMGYSVAYESILKRCFVLLVCSLDIFRVSSLLNEEYQDALRPVGAMRLWPAWHYLVRHPFLGSCLTRRGVGDVRHTLVCGRAPKLSPIKPQLRGGSWSEMASNTPARCRASRPLCRQRCSLVRCRIFAILVSAVDHRDGPLRERCVPRGRCLDTRDRRRRASRARICIWWRAPLSALPP